MKGKWAAGISPRNFFWIISDRLAVCERPGGYARSHRPVRRYEEILWIREQKFTRLVSLMASPHNLHAYDELRVKWEHAPFGLHDDPRAFLADLYPKLQGWLTLQERILLHQEELSDRLLGVVGGYLLYTGMITHGAQTISVIERITQRQLGPPGRQLIAVAGELSGRS